MRFVPLLFLALADCGSAAVTSPDTTVDPCPSAAATVAAGPTCGQAGGERFGRECATLRTVVPAQCLPAFDAHVRCSMMAPMCSASGALRRPDACNATIAAVTACTGDAGRADATPD